MIPLRLVYWCGLVALCLSLLNPLVAATGVVAKNSTGDICPSEQADSVYRCFETPFGTVMVHVLEGQEYSILWVDLWDISGDLLGYVKLDQGEFLLEDADLQTLRGGSTNDLLLTWRASGSGGFLSFAIVGIDESGIHVLLQGVDIAKGLVQPTSDGIRQSEAVYDATAPMLVPSAWKHTLWRWEGEQFVVVEIADAEYQSPLQALNINQMAFAGNVEQLIEEKALEAMVPPVLVKAIALVESGGRHFNPDGSVVMGAVGEIGIMQILPDPRVFSEEEISRLYELEYNIEAGIKVLIEKKMFSGMNRPTFVEPHDSQTMAMLDDILESWYFALWSYNGWVLANNPGRVGLGKTYQCKVLSRVEAMIGAPVAQPSLHLFVADALPAAGSLFSLPGVTYGTLPGPLPGATAVVNSSILRVREKPATVFGLEQEAVAIKGQLSKGDVVILLRGPSTATRARWYEIGADNSAICDPPLGWAAGQYKPGDRLHFDSYLIPLDLTATVMGRIHEPRGVGVTTAKVSLWRDGSLVAEGTSDGDGCFAITELAPGRYDIVIAADAYVQREISVNLIAGTLLEIDALTALLGDVNLDGYVNAADIVPLNRHALGIQIINNELSLLAADINQDGNVNAADIVPLNRYALGVDKGLGTGE